VLYNILLRLEDARILGAIHVIDLYQRFLLAAYQAVSVHFALMLDEGKHVDYRLSSFMERKQVEELLIVREV
jgi:hypothetical protein